MRSIMICDLKIGQWFCFAGGTLPFTYYVIGKNLYSVFVHVFHNAEFVCMVPMPFDTWRSIHVIEKGGANG